MQRHAKIVLAIAMFERKLGHGETSLLYSGLNIRRVPVLLRVLGHAHGSIFLLVCLCRGSFFGVFVMNFVILWYDFLPIVNKKTSIYG